MIKKLSCIIVFTILVTLFTVSSFGASLKDVKDSKGNDLIASTDGVSTNQFLVTITRPDGNETTMKKAYVISGVATGSNKENLTVGVAFYNKTRDEYVVLKDKDGDDVVWDVGKTGVFTKEINLPAMGKNDMKIFAYDNSDRVFKKTNNYQESYFTITVVDGGLKEFIKDGYIRITDIFKNFF